MAIKSFKRYEKKFLITETQYNDLIPKLMDYMNPDKFCQNNRTYSIYNIYYDTENNDVIRHSISKPYYKEKLRLRSYTIPTSANDRVFLELKKKIKGIVSKRRLSLSLGEAYEFLYNNKRPVIKDYMDKQVLHEIEYYLSKTKVYPTVFISYERNAFFCKDNPDFRVTFDSRVLTRRNHLFLEEGSFGEDVVGDGKYLMEVKILGAIPLWFTRILSELEIYPTHFSKYGNEFIKYCLNNKENNEIGIGAEIC